MATAAILNFFNISKAAVVVDIPMKFDERNPKKNLNPPFLFPWQLRQSLSNRFRFFLAYLVPLDNKGVDVDVVRIKFNQFLFGQ
jgi:hypothetical protein